MSKNRKGKEVGQKANFHNSLREKANLFTHVLLWKSPQGGNTQKVPRDARAVITKLITNKRSLRALVK